MVHFAKRADFEKEKEKKEQKEKEEKSYETADI